MSQNRLENNLSNEVTVMSDRIINLEKEKNELVDKYSKYGEEFKNLFQEEQQRSYVKLQKQKDTIKNLREKVKRAEEQFKE